MYKKIIKNKLNESVGRIYSSIDVINHIKTITPNDEDVPGYFLELIKRSGKKFRLVEVLISDLLKSDSDLLDYVNNSDDRYIDDDIEGMNLDEPIVVLGGEVLDGYNRVLVKHNLGYDKIEALVPVDEVIGVKLDEVALRGDSLGDGVCLYVGDSGHVSEFTLYDNVSDRVYGHLVCGDCGIGGYYDVKASSAERGYGPMMYEFVMMYLYDRGIKLMPNRTGDIRGDAWNLWVKFYNRREVIKDVISIGSDLFNVGVLDDGVSSDEYSEYISELSVSEKHILRVYNTAYSMVPNSDYHRFYSCGKSDVYNKRIHKRGLDFFSDKYGL